MEESGAPAVVLCISQLQLVLVSSHAYTRHVFTVAVISVLERERRADRWPLEESQDLFVCV